MVNNYLCETCDKAEVCKIFDVLAKFSEDAKKPLGVDISMESCYNYEPDDEHKKTGEDE